MFGFVACLIHQVQKQDIRKVVKHPRRNQREERTVGLSIVIIDREARRQHPRADLVRGDDLHGRRAPLRPERLRQAALIGRAACCKEVGDDGAGQNRTVAAATGCRTTRQQAAGTGM